MADRSSVSPGEILRHLSRPDALCWGRRVLFDWLSIALVIAGVGGADHPIGWLLGGILLGTRQHSLSLLGHDAVHFQAHPDRTWNDRLANLLVFWPLFGPLDGYRDFHFRHHRSVGTLDDPERPFKRWTPSEWESPMNRRRLARLLVRDLVGGSFLRVFQLGKLSPPRSLADRVGPWAWWIVVWCVLGALDLMWASYLWWWAYFTSYWATFRLRAITEHHGTAGTHHLAAGPLARAWFLPHNTWLHWEHHRFPRVPCWNLPRVRELVGSRPELSVGELFESLDRMPASGYDSPEREPTNSTR